MKWFEHFSRLSAAFQPKSMPSAETAAPGRLISSREALEFLPAALEIVETPVSPTIRATYYAICSLILFALVWACLTHVETVAIASGKIVPLGQVKVVQPLETAAIRAIYVQDGDHVDVGAKLLDLDPTDVTTELSSLLYDRDQAALDAEVARFLMAGDPDGRFDADDAKGLAESNRARAKAELTRFRAQVAGIAAEIAQKQVARETNAIAVDRAKAVIPLLEEKNTNAQSLYVKSFGLRAPVLESEQQLIEKRAEFSYATAYDRQIANEIDALIAKRDEVTAAFWADATDRHIKATQKMAGLDNQIEKARVRKSYRSLRAPVTGTVQGLKIHTPGAVVTTADSLLTIVPDDVGLEVEALVENKDIGFVKEGQAAEIKIEAFPFTRYGLIHGLVRKVSRDSILPQAVAQSASNGTSPAGALQATAAAYYAIKVSLDQDWIKIDGNAERLLPGMNASAEVRTGQRRVIEYLLSPILKSASEAARER